MNASIQSKIQKEELIKHLDHLANSMDTKWVLPLVKVRAGWDSLLGLVPGVGDSASALISLYIVYQAHRIGTPFWIKLAMLFNIFMDWLIGTIPLIGDLFDIGWKANIKNVQLIKQHRD